MLADCLLEQGRIDPTWVARTYLALATPKGTYHGAHRGIGRSFRLVLSELERGVSPHDTGQTSAGIGAAMRIAPVALYLLDEPEALLSAVMNASLMTHRDIRSLAGAMAVACAVRRLAMGEPRTPSLIFKLAADVARAEEQIAQQYAGSVVSTRDHLHAVSVAIANTEALLEIPRERAMASLVEEANRHGADPICRRATMGFPPACIPTCLYLLYTTDTFDDALIDVVNLGGDADTTGAILGAMAGAYYGDRAIPNRWLDRLQNQDGIALRAEALVRRDPSGLAIPDLIETERLLTERESATRDGQVAQRQNGGDLGANRRI